jgi:hypothetical protein
MNDKYSKQVKATLSGELLKKFRFFAHDEGMRESEAVRYLIVKGIKGTTEQTFA